MSAQQLKYGAYPSVGLSFEVILRVVARRANGDLVALVVPAYEELLYRLCVESTNLAPYR